jgi:hypothetical protein
VSDIDDVQESAGFYPAYEQVQGPYGPQGPRGVVGPQGPLGGGPMWQADYDVLGDIAFDLSTGLPYAKDWTDAQDSGQLFTGHLDWNYIEITPPEEPLPVLTPIEPGYAEWKEAHDAWEQTQMLDPNEVEIGVWIEGQARVHLGLSGPGREDGAFGGVYLGEFNLGPHGSPQGAQHDPESYVDAGPLGSAAIEGGGIVDHRLAWFTDQGSDLWVTGQMRRYNTVPNADERWNVGWAGPSYGIAMNQQQLMMRDIFRGGGVWEGLRKFGSGGNASKWHLCIAAADEAGSPGDGPVVVKAVRLRLSRYSRRLEMFQRIPTRNGWKSASNLNRKTALRGFAHFVHGGGSSGREVDKQIQVPPSQGGFPGSNQRWMPWRDKSALDQNVNAHYNDLDGFPSYDYVLNFPRPVFGIIRAGFTWSRYPPGVDPVGATPFLWSDADMGRWVMAQLVVGDGGIVSPEPRFASRDSDERTHVVYISRPDQVITHKMTYIGWFTQAAILMTNFTTRTLEPVGDDDNRHLNLASGAGQGLHGLDGDSGSIYEYQTPFIHVNEFPNSEYRDDELYDIPFGRAHHPYTGPD